MMPLLATTTPTLYWYATRGTGAVALVLLTLGLVLGVMGPTGIRTQRWPRFVVAGLHRNVTLLAVVFVALHVVTTIVDGFAPIGFRDALIPFLSPYRPLWLGLGTVAFDLLLALVVTSMVRRRIGYRIWWIVHWLAYADMADRDAALARHGNRRPPRVDGLAGGSLCGCGGRGGAVPPGRLGVTPGHPARHGEAQPSSWP